MAPVATLASILAPSGVVWAPMAGFTAMHQALLLQAECTNTSAPGTATVLLVSSTHDFDAAAGAFWVSEIVADEVAPTGYARQVLGFAGGATINADGNAELTWTDTAFGNLGGAVDATVGGVYVFLDTGDDATSPLTYSIPTDPAVSTDGAAYFVRWGTPTILIRG